MNQRNDMDFIPFQPDSPAAIRSCRSCGGDRLEKILDLGLQPVANALLTDETLRSPEPRYPLAVVFCHDCRLLQVTETVPAEVLYKRDYPYFSSQNPTLIDHGRHHVEHLIADRKLTPESLVVEVASNDGYLLRHFVERGIPVLGIDPADGPAARANEIGVPTVCDFFSTELGKRLAEAGRPADVTIASNVAAHVDRINDFIGGFPALLKPDGIGTFEWAYAVDMIEKCEFDTIYHEHLFYHTLHGFTALVERHGLHVIDAERLAIHGGSLRVRVAKTSGRSARLDELWADEKRRGVDKAAFYRDFGARVERLAADLRALLRGLKSEGKRIACYGAAAKGATMMNYLNLGEGFFDYVIDRSVHKQGKYMPGQRIPIRAPEALDAERPDYVLILAWNFADDIMRENAAFAASDGRFILPVPEPRIV